MSNDRKKIDDLIDIVEGAMELVDENEGRINRILGENDSINLGDDDLLSELIKNDEKVMITTEVKDDLDSVSISKKGDDVVIGMNDKELVAEVPDDCNVTQANADLNNGVLSVVIPRGE